MHDSSSANQVLILNAERDSKGGGTEKMSRTAAINSRRSKAKIAGNFESSTISVQDTSQNNVAKHMNFSSSSGWPHF